MRQRRRGAGRQARAPGRPCPRRARLGADPFLVPGAYVDRAHQIAHARDGVTLHVGGDALEQLRPDERVDEIGGANLHGVCPAIMNSSTSRASAMPPMPMIGICTACRHSYTMRTAIGRMAGPLRPPTMFEIFGRRVSTSITIARNVFTSDTASAPASSAARANEATSVTFGVSFGMTGSRVTFRTALVTS